jgi:hypothetical protein
MLALRKSDGVPSSSQSVRNAPGIPRPGFSEPRYISRSRVAKASETQTAGARNSILGSDASVE